jgi:DNA invertase Pin-like site-specific DNA recombinase
VVYELTVGPIPEGLFVLHSCDNPPCCNPAHLRAGTQKENIEDAVERDRLARGRALPQAKLTEAAVREIRRRSGEGRSQRAVAAEFGVSHDTVGKILRGKRWTHVT